MNNRSKIRIDYKRLHTTGEKVPKAEAQNDSSSSSSQTVSAEVDPVDHLKEAEEHNLRSESNIDPSLSELFAELGLGS